MKQKKLEFFKNLLLEKRTELMDQLGIIKETSFKDTIKDSSGDNSAYSFHMADQGTDTQEREKAFMFAYREGRLIYHIDEALERIDKGRFGKCKVCQGEVEIESLEMDCTNDICLEHFSEHQKRQLERDLAERGIRHLFGRVVAGARRG